jgi:probable phosphoglycerate mutase
MTPPPPPLVFALAVFVGIVLVSMRPRRFYFVRHGETVLNFTRIRQGSDGGLTDKGKAQASRTGEALKQFPIKRIISSTYERARETSAIINQYLKVPILFSPLLVERKNPHEIVGRPVEDPEVVHIVDLMDLSFHDDDFRISDEENFLDLRERAHKCLDLLAHQGQSGTVVVTHHHFLKMLIAYLLYRTDLHATDFAKLSFFNAADNAAVTICVYHPWKMFSRTRGWEVVTYNEHLGG